ncbi:histidine phosphatase family protein [Gaiella sp.]|uniref:histidine phosphatase family protein n=1 Tax=Gaiella sp. TaxID=2663207 RepID=UPI002E34715C|nr:histidine phosphatase family protein [Gaiella sp.]HEX5582585.1 histidine phosphatase family protein [Gaiella sp.]
MTGDSLWLVRHGETEWSRDGRHTSLTDVPLTEPGVAAARELGHRLAGHAFSLVLTSPRLRARHTAELAGFPNAVVDDDLAEWFYGTYEGITTDETRAFDPTWTVWTHPSPGGETAAQVAGRADRVIARACSIEGDVLLFGHGHALRALTARWLGQDVADGRLYHLDTGTISVLGYERDTPVIVHWNG